MNPSSPRLDEGSEQSLTQDSSHGDDERRRQQERLSREEAYYQFINELSEEDYRLMRDRNLLGTPGEITAEELHQRLNAAKEHLASQISAPNVETVEDETVRGPEATGESSNGDSLLEWLNTFRRTGNTTRSGQSGNQTWRAVSRTNPNSGEFRFSLEININHDYNDHTYETTNEEPMDTSNLENNTNRSSASRPQRPPSPVARRTRNRSQPGSSNELRNNRNTRSRNRSQPGSSNELLNNLNTRSTRTTEVRNVAAHSFSGTRQLRRTTSEQVRTTRRTPQRGRTRNTVRHSILNTNGIQHRSCEGNSGVAQLREQEEFGQTGVQTRSRQRQLDQLRHRTFENSRSRSPLLRPSSEDHNQQSQSRPSEHMHTRASRRREVVDQSTSSRQDEDQVLGSTPSQQLLDFETPSGAVLDEADSNISSRPSVTLRRHPTITLDLQVRRIRPGENRDRDSIASRTRSRLRSAENTVTFESDSGGFRRTISRSERAGIRTYVSTIRIPLRRISETGMGEPSSVALRSILRQIMTGFGELNSLMETESDSEVPRNSQHSSGDIPETNNLQNDTFDSQEMGEFSVRNLQSGEQIEENGRENEGTPPSRQNHENQDSRQSQDASSLVENGTLPILRLAHFFLLNEDDDDDHPRGLTKEQIDNLSTRNYGDSSFEIEISKTCSVCISEYAVGNKLRKLPCAHEFHIHCIDRWLSQNSTCPICRQPILGPSTVEAL